MTIIDPDRDPARNAAIVRAALRAPAVPFNASAARAVALASTGNAYVPSV